MNRYADGELEDLVRSAFAEMMPQLLDERAPRPAVGSRSEEVSVAAPIELGEASADSGRPRARILAGAAVVALVVAGLALIGRNTIGNDSTNSPVSNPTATLGATTTPTVDGSASVAAPYLAPLALPPGWKVWTFSRSNVSNPTDTTQVFGRYDGTPLLTAAILVTTEKSQGGQVDGSVAVRGQHAVLSSGTAESNLSWGEDGLAIDAQFRGITVDQAVGFLNALTWRADHLSGFEPGSAPPELPLLREAIAEPPGATLETIYRIIPTDGPTFGTDYLSTYGAADDEIQVTVWAGPAGAPELVYQGERQPDGSIAYHAPEGVGPAHGILRPDGSIVSVIGRGDSDLQWTIVSSMRPATGADLDNLENETSSILESLPEVGQATVGDATIVLRGGTTDQPIAQCLVITGASRCRRSLPAREFVGSNLGFVTAVNLGGRWLLYGSQPSSAPSVQVLPWAPGMSDEIDAETRSSIGVSSSESAGHRWWVSEIPAGRGIDDVIMVGSTDTQIDAVTLRTSYHRNDWDGQGA